MSRAVLFMKLSDSFPSPLRDFAAALVGCGDDVHVYAPEYLQDSIKSAGAVFHPYQTVVSLHSAHKMAVGLQLIRAAHDLLPGILDDLRQNRPDYILYDSHSVWGWYAAHILKIPSVSLFAAPIINREVLIRSGKLSGELSGFWQHLETMSQYRKIASALEYTYAIPAPGISSVMYNKGDLNLMQTVDVLHPWASSLDSSYRFIGVNDTVPTHTPVNLFIAPDAVDIAEPISAVFTEAAHRDPALQKSHWLVTHGSMNAVHTALLTGRLLLIVPQTVEQDVLAEHLHQLEVGIRLHGDSLHQFEFYASIIAQQNSAQRMLQHLETRLKESSGVDAFVQEICKFKHALTRA